MTLGYVVPLTLGIDRFECRDALLNDGGGELTIAIFEFFLDSGVRGVFSGWSSDV